MPRNLLLFLFLTFASTTAYADCRIEFHDAEIELVTCTNDEGLRTVNLALQPPFSAPLYAEGWYDLWLSPVLPQRLRGTSIRRELTAADQEIIRRSLLNPSLSDSAQAFLRFLAFFAEPGFPLADYDLSGRNLLIQASYTSICRRIGHSATATYTLGGRTITKRMNVGGSNCLGQCGVGCQDPSNPRNGRYTQECLNHDACAYATGNNMGECEDEFWAAADGFFNAPLCQ